MEGKFKSQGRAYVAEVGHIASEIVDMTTWEPFHVMIPIYSTPEFCQLEIQDTFGMTIIL